MRDLYEVLGVDRGASKADLKRAYRNLAQQCHPDKCPGDKSAEEKFKEAANAYQVLSDDEKRAIYDRAGADGLRGHGDPGFGPGGFPGGFRNVDDILNTFGDLFSDFFGRAPKTPPRGSDLRVDLELTFAEAVWGATKDVRVSREAPCAPCSGSGSARHSKPEPCLACRGTGQVTRSQGFFMVQSRCTACHGVGKRIKDVCPACRGQGTQTEMTTLAVDVPPGVDDGQTLRLAGKGDSVPSGAAGHLYIVLRVEEDERFKRDGEDVVTEVPISFVDAALGGEITVPTLDDDTEGTATVELPAGTQPGDEVVRRGQGIARLTGGYGRGDQVVRWKIEIPKKLTRRQKELLRELAEDLGTADRRQA